MGEPIPGNTPANKNILPQPAKEIGIQVVPPVDSNEKIDRLVKFKREIVDNIGFIPLSSKETQRYLRGTYLDEAEEVCKDGYGIERDNGFSGNAVALGFDEDSALNGIDNTHRGTPVALFFTYPNVRPDAVKLQKEGKLPRLFYAEILATNHNLNPASVRASMVSHADLVVDPQFVEGYYDKDEKKYHPNPKFWENILKEKAEQEGWTREEYETHRQEQLTLLRQQALQRLKEEVILFQKKEEKEARDMLEYYAGIENSDVKEVELPIP